MEFFTNRIMVNQPKKSFSDIVREVTDKGGMKKKASSQEKEAELKGKQDKIDMNGNGKIDSEDFSLLRKKKKKKKASADDVVKISSITPNKDGTVTIDINSNSVKLAEEDEVVEAEEEEIEEEEIEDSEDSEENEDGEDSEENEETEETEDSDDDNEDSEDSDDDSEDSDDDSEDSEKSGKDFYAMVESFEKEMGWSKDSGSQEKESEEKCGCGTNYASEDLSSSDKKASSVRFVKIANLTEKQKGVFRDYWSNIWPKEFIDAVLDTEN
jgi:hypothetical protein